MTKDQEHLEQINTVAAVVQLPEEPAQTVSPDAPEMALTEAQIVELLTTLGSVENELEIKRELSLGMEL